MKPWEVYIKGMEDIPLFRSVTDVAAYEGDGMEQKKRLTELFYKAGIIKKERECCYKGKDEEECCDGRLLAKCDKNAKADWARHGGFYYVCENSGLKETQCNKKDNTYRKAITYGSVLHNARIGLMKLLQLIYSYCRIGHKVTLNYIMYFCI